MESPKTIDTLLEDLRALSPNGAEYLELMMHELEPFNVSEYEDQPEIARHSLPNLEDDQAELQNEIDQAIQNGASRGDIQATLQKIASSLSTKPVTLWAFHPVFRHFGALPKEDPDDDPSEDTPIRFYMPNLLFDTRQTDEFFKKCGLIEDTRGGSGSHTKWMDQSSSFCTVRSQTGKKWLKRIIKQMVESGFPIDRIQNACDSLGIDFRVLNG